MIRRYIWWPTRVHLSDLSLGLLEKGRSEAAAGERLVELAAAEAGMNRDGTDHRGWRVGGSETPCIDDAIDLRKHALPRTYVLK